MTVTLVLPTHIADDLFNATVSDIETACVLLARHVELPSGSVRLLARALHWVPENAYFRRDTTSLSIASHGYVPALAEAEADQCVPIWLHTHPGQESSPRPSKHDELVDEQLSELFRLRAGSPLYGAIVLARTGGRVCFTGHIESQAERRDVDRVWVTGRRFTLIQNWSHYIAPPSDQFDRNIRAFGGEIQQVLGNLHIAVVGCGGTGSAAIEQLVRLGVRHLHLFDPDTLTVGNVTRVYGSYLNQVGEPKVNLIAAHIGQIAPDAEVVTTQAKITRESAARQLLDADVIFGCTDDNAGRLVLSRMASYLLTPVIDCGVLLSSGSGGQLIGIDGRVTVLAPGAACLVCRNRVDLQQAAAEMLATKEHSQLVKEGYAPALLDPQPAVVAYTTQVASAAVSELLERLIHYGPEPAPTEILIRSHEREVSTNDQDPIDRHYCHPEANKLGLGITEPFLEQTWQG
ncbi:MAG: ThiF family adenylyltransferase [Candidatus Tectomicrobia bacterium]|nr:ThiF family adenylyltransferase [Candidatus Tectomicrobia bacterium]